MNLIFQMGFYLLAAANVAALMIGGLYAQIGWAAVVAILLGLAWLGAIVRRERQDAVPATTVGVLIHAAACLAIAGAILWG